MSKLNILIISVLFCILINVESNCQNKEIEYKFSECFINNQPIFDVILDFVSDNYECVNKSENTYIYIYADLDSNKRIYLTFQIEELKLNIGKDFPGYYLFENFIFLIDSTVIALDYFRLEERKNSVTITLKPTFGFLLLNKNDEYVFLFNDVFPINHAMRTFKIEDNNIYSLIYDESCEYEERKVKYDSLLNEGWRIAELEDFLRYRIEYSH